jgi:hypothetical protein
MRESTEKTKKLPHANEAVIQTAAALMELYKKHFGKGWESAFTRGTESKCLEYRRTLSLLHPVQASIRHVYLDLKTF